MKAAPLLAASILLATMAGAAIALTLATPTPTLPRTTAYSPGSGNLTQLRQAILADGYPVQAVVARLTAVDDNSLLVIPDAQRVPTPAETQALENHLAHGGSIWAAGGTGLQPWLSSKGLAVGTQHLLQSSAATPGAVSLTGVIRNQTIAGINSMLPSILLPTPGQGWQGWLQAPADAALDLDADGLIGRSDPPGPFMVGAFQVQASGGILFATADASLLTNGAWETSQGQNVALLHALLNQIHPRMVVLDESQHGWVAAEGPWVAAAAAAAWAKGLPLWILLAATILAVSLTLASMQVVPPLTPYAPHVTSDDPVPPLFALEEWQTDIALELLARRTGRPLAELRAAGTNAAQGLAEDPVLRRVLLGRGTQRDCDQILEAYARGDRT